MAPCVRGRWALRDRSGADRSGADRWSPSGGPSPSPVRARCGSGCAACGVCRTDLHLAEGDLPPRRPGTVPGHEIVGVVDGCGPGATRFAPGRPDRHRLAARDVRALPVVPLRPGEPLPGRPLHRMGRRRRLRRAGDGAGGVRLPAARGARRRPRRAAAVRGHRRLPRAEAGRAAARRPAGDLRLRGVRARRRAGGDRPGGAGARADALRGGPGAGARARGSVGGPGRRCAARAVGRRGAVRAGGRAGAGGAAGAGPGRDAGRRGDPPQRRAGAELRRPSCSGRSSCAASPRTPAPTARSSCGWRPRCASGRRSGRARWPRPTGRWRTSPRTG